jgi:hypothetical protein
MVERAIFLHQQDNMSNRLRRNRLAYHIPYRLGQYRKGRGKRRRPRRTRENATTGENRLRPRLRHGTIIAGSTVHAAPAPDIVEYRRDAPGTRTPIRSFDEETIAAGSGGPFGRNRISIPDRCSAASRGTVSRGSRAVSEFIGLAPILICRTNSSS